MTLQHSLFAMAIAAAQSPTSPPPLVVAANIDARADVVGDTPIEITLSRPLLPNEGDLALVVAGVDVTAVAERRATSITYSPSVVPLSPGDTEVVVYRRAGGRWSVLRRFSITVLSTAQSSRPSLTQSATLGNKGQLAEGRSRGLAEPDRRTFQDFVLNAGLNSTHAGQRWSLETQSNYVGVSRREEALRFGIEGRDAPKLDLSSYLVTLRAPKAALSLGHVSFGSSRHLANAFSSRGGSVVLTHRGTTVSVGALNGSSQVGWSDLVGLDRPTHRILGASLGHEVLPTQPGALRFDLTLIDGSVLPLTSFTQGAIVDAEQSEGGSLQISAATPNQRLRFSGGYTRSRFDNPARDAQLAGDSTIVPVRRSTRGARFVELNATPLQNVRLPLAGPTSVALGWRHERVDPLYRSVAAPTGADRQQHSADAAISLGAITTLVSQSWTRDNLDRVPSVLTSRGRAATANVALPLAAMVGNRRHAWMLPMVTAAFNRNRQFAAGLPMNGAFRAQDLPDQVSLNGDLAALWQAGRWRLTLRANRSTQDNRQELRERADFAAGVDALTIGFAFGQAGELGVDLANEYQTSKERDETTRVRRFTLNASLRPRESTNLLVALSALRTKPPTEVASFNSDQRVELSQGLGIWRDGGGAPRGQLFLRYARITSLVPDFSASATGAINRLSRRQWSLASGVNLRLF